MKKYYKIIDGKQVFFKGILVVDDKQIINPTEDQLLSDGWVEYVEPELTPEELLQQAKDAKLAEIETYDQSPAVNSFTINGKEMWLDATLRQQLRTSVNAYQAMGNVNVTKWFGGIEYVFSITQWLQMLNTLEIYAADALNVTESHKAAVNGMDNIESINGYDITLGYPQKIVF